MTDLSPAAQSVMDAYYSTDSLRSAPALAAVLRAVADQIYMKRPLGDTDADAGVFAAHRVISNSLRAIADELEGIKYGTYRCELEGQ
jgi:hypothetical protein